MVKLEANFTPIQDLNGQEAPYPPGGGKNLLPMTVEGIKAANTGGTWDGNSYTFAGVTFEIQTDDANNVIGIKANNTATSAVVFWLGKIDYVSNTQLYLNAGVQTGDSSIYFRVSGFGKNVYTDANITDCQGSDTSINLSASGELWGNVRVGNGKTVNNLIFKPYVFSSANPMTAFAPYSNICPISGHTGCDIFDKAEYDAQATPTVYISFGTTVYGGKLTVFEDGSGQAVVDRAGISTTWGALTFHSDQTNTRRKDYSLTELAATDKATREKSICNIAVFVNDTADTIHFQIQSNGMTARFFLPISAADDTPIQMVYYLAEPVVIPLTPGQIQTRVGENVVWVNDSDNIQVTAYGSPID